MKVYIIINDKGEEIQRGSCPDNCDFTTAFGRPPSAAERYLIGKGETEQEAREEAYCSEPIKVGGDA